LNRFLPDVNLLLALLDPMHIHHEAAHRWYAGNSPMQMLTCSHVENGVIRVSSQPKYPNCLGTGSRAREILRTFVGRVNAEFCGTDVSLLDDAFLVCPGLLTPSRIADLYLLGLAASHGARLATFDYQIPAEAVAKGPESIEIIPVSDEDGE